MKTHNFSASRIILPHHRQDFLLRKHRSEMAERLKRPLPDEQRLQQFQVLLERSLNEGLVIQIVTASESGRMVTTGVVKQFDIPGRKIHVRTLEESRVLSCCRIIEILE